MSLTGPSIDAYLADLPADPQARTNAVAPKVKAYLADAREAG